jgi:hypothetical protein
MNGCIVAMDHKSLKNSVSRRFDIDQESATVPYLLGQQQHSLVCFARRFLP